LQKGMCERIDHNALRCDGLMVCGALSWTPPRPPVRRIFDQKLPAGSIAQSGYTTSCEDRNPKAYRATEVSQKIVTKMFCFKPDLN